MNILIKQPAGLGDILYGLKIATTVQEKDDIVYWPVSAEYFYLKDYIFLKDIVFCVETENFPGKDVYLQNPLMIQKTNELYFIPLNTSDRVVRKCKCHGDFRAHGHMKYDFAGVARSNWAEGIEIKRNFEREQMLMEKLGISPSSSYNVVNQNYGTFPGVLTRNDLAPSGTSIPMKFIPGVNIFDWMGVMEHAKEIHVVESGIRYILQIMGRTEGVYIYSRFPGQNDNFAYMIDDTPPQWNLVQ